MSTISAVPQALEQLPSYSPSDPAPSYSYEPSCDEQTLQLTPNSSRTRSATGTYVKRSGKTTVVLTEQEEGADLPTYGRHGSINGTLIVEQSEMITEIEAKIEGKMDTTISEGGGRSVKLIDEHFVLWSRETAGPSSSPLCPSQIPFTFILPSHFRDGDTDKALPPSYHFYCKGVPTLFLKSTYTIRFTITRLVSKKVGFWTKSKNVLVPFKYYPRTRPHRPILHLPTFFSSVKTSPEEWYQAVSNVKPRPPSGLGPLTTHLFIPAGRVYGVVDTIPFHLQISGHIDSLRQLFSSTPALDRVRSTDSHLTEVSETPAEPESPVIRVQLLRQVKVELRGQKSWRNAIIGEGSLCSVPPLHSSYDSETCSERHLDWEGELKCDPSVTVGGFSVANVEVKEFVVLTITPAGGPKSPLLDLQVAVPIRLVTDSWGDTTGLDTSG